MKISNPSKRNIRYFSNPNYFLFFHYKLKHFNPPKTLICAASFGCPILSSYFLNPTSYSLIFITGFCSFSETYQSSHPLYMCKCNGYRSLSSFSSNGLPSLSSLIYPHSQALQVLGFSRCNIRYIGCASQILNLDLMKSMAHGCFRLYSVSSTDASRYKKLGTGELRPKATAKQVSEIVNWLTKDKDDWESKLKVLNVRLSIASGIHVFEVLNNKKKSALQFFHWIRIWQPELGMNSDICSLVVDNCGRLGHYNAMQCLLNDFKLNRLSLTKKAFEFLPVMAANEELLRKSTQSVIDMLHEVGGTCYGTGVYSLVELFCVLGSFDMAKFVIETTERKLSYYGVFIREMCRRCDFEGAGNMMDEMRMAGCEPNAQIYNYIISCLLRNGKKDDACKLFQEMKEKNCPPDALTFEIFIHDSCKDHKFDIAFEFFDEMVSRGLEPRLSTHAVFIKGFFNSQQYGEAYKYVVGSDDKYSASMNYTLLASLHQKRGNLVAAENILSEMIKKGLRPHFKVYMKVLKNLGKSGDEKLALDLQQKFFQLEHRA